MLDPQLDAPARDGLVGDARGQIEAAGTLKTENNWGLRKMAYEINKRTEADYRWLRFEGANELLDTLDHNLKIADGVLRFRIFKVDADTPVTVPPATAAPGPSASRERPAAPEAPPAPAEAAPEAAAEEEVPAAPVAVAEPPAESAEPEAEVPEPEAETAEPAEEAVAESAEPAAEAPEAEAGEASGEGESGDSTA